MQPPHTGQVLPDPTVAALIRSRRPGRSRSAPDVRHLDTPQSTGVIGPDLRVSVNPARPDSGDGVGHLLVARIRTHKRTEIMSLDPEQAREQLTSGRDSGPDTGGAERPRH